MSSVWLLWAELLETAPVLIIFSICLLLIAATAGTNKAASSGTSLNTKKLAEDTENLARESYILYFQYCSIFFITLHNSLSSPLGSRWITWLIFFGWFSLFMLQFSSENPEQLYREKELSHSMLCMCLQNQVYLLFSFIFFKGKVQVSFLFLPVTSRDSI